MLIGGEDREHKYRKQRYGLTKTVPTPFEVFVFRRNRTLLIGSDAIIILALLRVRRLDFESDCHGLKS